MPASPVLIPACCTSPERPTHGPRSGSCPAPSAPRGETGTSTATSASGPKGYTHARCVVLMKGRQSHQDGNRNLLSASWPTTNCLDTSIVWRKYPVDINRLNRVSRTREEPCRVQSVRAPHHAAAPSWPRAGGAQPMFTGTHGSVGPGRSVGMVVRGWVSGPASCVRTQPARVVAGQPRRWTTSSRSPKAARMSETTSSRSAIRATTGRPRRSAARSQKN